MGDFDLYEGLNPEQRAVVDHDEGPIRVGAVAGSGKTRALVTRVAALIARGVDPGRILALTFSKKAADEMNNRLVDLGVSDARIGTFHSFALEVLRAERDAPFEIDDRERYRTIVKQVVGFRGMNWTSADVTLIREFIGRCKAAVELPASPEARARADQYARRKPGPQTTPRLLCEAYQRAEVERQSRNLLTFDDMLLDVAVLFANDEDVRARWAARYDRVLQDEAQDVNPAQNAIALAMARDHRNYMVVGDPAQCIPAGQMVSTPSGTVPIESIRKGDVVLSARRGKLVPQRVVNASRTHKGVALEFDLGKYGCFRATREHVLFAAIDDPAGSYLYLMWRHDLGFRCGVTRTVGNNGTNFVIRTQQENAERMWVLEWHPTYGAAAEAEAVLSYRFGIPREPFVPRKSMWSGTKEATARLFNQFGRNGVHALGYYDLDFDRPNYFAKTSGRGRIAVNLRVAGRDGHLVECETTVLDPTLAAEQGMTKTGRGSFHARRMFGALRDARDFAERLARNIGGYVVEHLACTGAVRRALAVPASGVHPGMRVPFTGPDGVVMNVPVVARRSVVAGDCYDLEVERLGNFVVNGVVVHNSIYQFRGADPASLMRFADEWPGFVDVSMSRNYRCGRAIAEAANGVLRHMAVRLEGLEIQAERAEPGLVDVHGYEDQDDEARAIAAKMLELNAGGADWGGMCCLYRTNAQSRALEEALLAERIPHVVIGGTPFYMRREVADLLAYLRAAVPGSRWEDVKRSINAPFRYLATAFLERVERNAHRFRDDWVTAVRESASESGIQARQRSSAEEWCSLIRWIEGEIKNPGETGGMPGPILDRVVMSTRFMDWLTKDEGEETVENSRASNVRELVRAAEKFKSVPEFLTYVDDTIARARQERRKAATGARVTLMTVHKSKGLEFPRVWIISMNDKILPHGRAVLEPNGMEEERRLAYVAMTRAKDELRISCVGRATIGPKVVLLSPSQFLAEAGLEVPGGDIGTPGDDDDVVGNAGDVE